MDIFKQYLVVNYLCLNLKHYKLPSQQSMPFSYYRMTCLLKISLRYRLCFRGQDCVCVVLIFSTVLGTL